MLQSQRPSVIIVGGGPVGLSCSILLSLRNIPHVLFERHPHTSIHPKACGINQRTTEIFRVMGVEDEVYRHAAPFEIAGRTAWYTGLGPNGKEIVSRDAWGGGKYADEYANHSPSRYCILPQIRLEPILRQRAVQLNPEGVRYNHEVLQVRNDYGHAAVIVKDRESEHEERHEARYVLVCDGGRTFTDQLGIAWEGEKDLFDMVTAHFRAPLRSLHPDPRNFITWFSNPEMGGSTKTGYMYQIGPWPSTKSEDEEWVFACGRVHGDPDRFDEETMLQRLRKTIGIPDLSIEMLSFSHWSVNCLYAQRWRIGRLFLVGDAAHRIPPWGALGMNSGIQDAQNLVWKLELALGDEAAYDQLLGTYETERLEVGRRVGLTSLHNMQSHSNVIDAALGVSADKTSEENKHEAEGFFDPSRSDHFDKRAAVDQAQRILDTEFKAPGFEVGWFYPSADINGEGGDTHDGQQLTDGSLNPSSYIPTTIPGHHLPHIWLVQNGKKCALRDLLALSKLTLFTVEQPSVANTDGRVRVELIEPSAWQAISGAWAGGSGGLLVRPDGIIAWRGDISKVTAEPWRDILDRILHCSYNLRLHNSHRHDKAVELALVKL